MGALSPADTGCESPNATTGDNDFADAATLSDYFGTTRDQARAVRELLEPVYLRGGDWLFHQGDPGDALYLIVSGRLQVWIGAETDTAQRHVVADAGPGESVGEIGMLTGEPRTASLRAIRDTRLLRVGQHEFNALAEAHPQLALRLGRMIARRLRERTAPGAGYARNLHRIAVVYCGEHDATDFGQTLSERLSAMAVTRHVTRTSLPEELAQAAKGENTELQDRISAWLNDEEERHRYLLLDTAGGDQHWRELCIRQSDLVLLVANATSAPDTAQIRQQLDGDSSARRILVLLQPEGDTEFSGTGSWIDATSVSEHLHVRTVADIDRVARTIAGRAIGLVMGGGAARGFAHIGVYQALVKSGIPVDRVGGTSVGAVVGAGIALGMPPDAVRERLRKAFVADRPFSDFTLPVVSVLRGRRMADALEEALPQQIEDLALPFFCTSTNLAKAELQVHERGPLGQSVIASASLPGVFPPRVINGDLAVDGGLLNNLPVDVMAERAVGRIIAVDLSASKQYQLDYTEVPGPMRILLGRWLPFLKRYRVPGITTLLLKAQEVASLVHARETRGRAELLLRPPVAGFGLTDVRPFDQIVEAGYRHAMEAL